MKRTIALFLTLGTCAFGDIFSDQTSEFLKDNIVSIQVPDSTLAVTLKWYDESVGFSEYPLTKSGSKWKRELPKPSRRAWYRFKITLPEKTVWFNAAGISNTEPGVNDFWIVPGFTTPDWSKHAIYYQIYVDRFKNGDSDNDPQTGEYLYEGNPILKQAWGELPESAAKCRDFFGGDLQGIASEINTHLKTLGINALYLNPIFRALSNHKYDTQDYRTVDKHFGGEHGFQQLMNQAKGSGVRVILDGVFNHTGTAHYWFDKANDFESAGAFESQWSEWFDFYTFSKWPTKYVGWANYDTLPKLDYKSATLRNEMYRDPNSIVQHWAARTDGWRLDVAGEIGAPHNETILHEMRLATKKANPEAILLGEIWHAANANLAGDQLDSITNYYGFAEPVSRFLTGKTVTGEKHPLKASDFAKWLDNARAAYPHEVSLSMMNLIDSHDTPRFLWRANGDKRKLKMAVALQMTYVGSPIVYYGDEVGLSGGADPDNRRTFPWNRRDWDTDLFAWYQKWIAFRNQHEVLRTGSFKLERVDDEKGIYSFSRFNSKEKITVTLRLEDFSVSAAVTKFKKS